MTVLLHFLRELLIWFGPIIGVTMMGSETEQGAILEVKAKRMGSQQVTATVTGKVEALVFMLTAEPAATEIWLGIAEDNAGAPGTIIGSASSPTKPKAKTLYTINLGTAVNVTSGTKYWLIALSIGGAIKMEGVTGGEVTVRLSTKETFTKIEATTEWVAATNKGPTLFYATGTAGGSKIGEGVAEIKGGGRIQTSGIKQTEGPSTIQGGGKIATTGVAASGSESKIRGGGRVSTTSIATGVSATTIRGGGRITTTSITIASSPTILIRGGGRINTSTGAKTAEGGAIIRGGGRIVTSGIRIAPGGSSTIRGGGRITSTGRVVATGAALIRGGGRVSTTSNVIVSGVARISGGGRVITTVEGKGIKVSIMYPSGTMNTTFPSTLSLPTYPSTLVTSPLISSEEGSQ